MTAEEALDRFAKTNVADREMQVVLYEAGYLDYDGIRGKYSLNEIGRLEFRRRKESR